MFGFWRKQNPGTKLLGLCETLALPAVRAKGELATLPRLDLVAQNEFEKTLSNELPGIKIRAEEIATQTKEKEWLECLQKNCKWGFKDEPNCCGLCGGHMWINFLFSAAEISGIGVKTICELEFEDMMKLGILVCEYYRRMDLFGWGRMNKRCIDNRKTFVLCFEFSRKTGKEQMFFDELKKHEVSWTRRNSLLFPE